ncbi:hypothetical protein N9933_00820 [bacterium]|nr:hypothetical protein [bacterium]
MVIFIQDDVKPKNNEPPVPSVFHPVDSGPYAGTGALHRWEPHVGLPASSKNQLDVLFSHDINVLKDVINGSSRIRDDSRSWFTYSTLPEINYGIRDRVAVTGLFSHIVQRRQTRFGGQEVEDLFTSGIGDFALLIKFNLLKPTSSHTLSLGLGPKLPVGKYSLSDGDGILLPADLQPGTGAIDGILWGFYSNSTLFRKRGSFSMITTFRYTSENDRYGKGSYSGGYKFGKEFLSTASLGAQAVVLKQVLDYSLSAQYRFVGPDRFFGNPQPSTGGHWGNIIPALRWNISTNLTLQAAGSLPVYRNLVDVQLTTSYKITGELYWKFDTKKKK